MHMMTTYTCQSVTVTVMVRFFPLLCLTRCYQNNLLPFKAALL